MSTADHEQWMSCLCTLLEPLLGDLVDETAEYLSTLLIDVQFTPNLTLTELSDHVITTTLEHELSPFIEIESWPLLTDELIDLLLTPPPPSPVPERIKGCELCHRETKLTAHHLVPRSTHTYFLTHPHLLPFTTDKMGLRTLVAMVCRPCHSTIHATCDNRSLGRDYHSVQALMTLPNISKFVQWNSRQKN